MVLASAKGALPAAKARPCPKPISPPFKAQVRFHTGAQERGYIHQCSDLEGLDTATASGATPAYIGFDATATSLHVGSLIQIMLLRRLQQAGHKPIVVMGRHAHKVGDPSARTPNARCSRRADPGQHRRDPHRVRTAS